MPIQTTDIKLTLTDDQRNTIGQDILRKIRSSRQGMGQMLTDIQEWRDLYEGFLPPKDFPWPQCSNTNIPMIQYHVDTLHANINTVTLTVSPITLVSCPPYAGDENKQLGKRVEDFLEYVQLRQMKLPELADMCFLESLLTPAAVAKVRWAEEYRVARRYQPSIDPETGEDDIEEVEVQEPKQIGPTIDLVDLANFVIYPLRSASVECAQLVGDRYWLSRDDILRRIQSGQFDASAEAVLNYATTEAGQGSDNNERDEMERMGLDPTDAEQFEFWDVLTGYDSNGDKLNEECRFVIEARSGIVVRATKFPYSHGRRYYVPFRPYPRPNRFFGRATPQILEGIQRQVNSLHNQRVDSTTIAINKVFLQRKGSSVDPDNLTIYPGAVIPVDNVDDVREVQISPNVPGIDIEQQLQQYGERSTGINDIAAARGINGDKTLGEVAMTSSAGGIRFGELIRRLQSSMIEISTQVLGLCYQFCTDDELEAFGLTRDDLIKPWELDSHGNTSTANKMQIRQEANLLYNTLATNPLVAQDVSRVYRLTRDYLLAYDRTDVENYIGTEDELKQAMQGGDPQQLQQILQAMSQILGVPPEVMLQAAAQAEQMIGGQGGQPGSGTMGGTGTQMGAGPQIPD